MYHSWRGTIVESKSFASPRYDEHFFRDFVAQHHVRYSKPTEKIIRRYQLKPVVLIRSLYDTTMSLRDHIRRDGVNFPMAYFAESDRSKSDAELEQMIAHLAVPWYLNFYMSWRDVEGTLLVNYHDVRADPVAVVDRVLQFAGRPTSREEIEKAVAAVDPKKTRYNKGVSDRGLSMCPEAKDTIRRLVKLYATEDDRFLSEMLEVP